MKIISTIVLSFILCGVIYTQVAPDKYWVRFTDKNNSPFSIDNPTAFLSQRAVDRRLKQGIEIRVNDLPVNPLYIQAVASTGATILTISRWFNSVTVYTTSSSVINAINQLPFVLSVQLIATGSSENENKGVKPFFENESYVEFLPVSLIPEKSAGKSYSYGQAFNQISMLNGIALHDLGYNGTGMMIAVIDAGFTNTNTIPAFSYLWNNNRILGFKDFVNPQNPNIFSSHSHGTMVLSTIGANLPGQMVGTAPEASFWLLRSEDGASEYLIEELNWVSAAEFADSVGVDVINSSLGYTTFDNTSQNHTYSDMDGNTTPVTRAADIAVSKGMIVVNSAGNDGSSSWYYIGAPADGDSVFSIGAVNSSGNYASFSSHGPTFDGRMKPDVVAQGSGTTIISASTGNVITGSGTSFSSPVTAGMVACLWQAHPHKRNTDLLQAIRQSGSLAGNPNYNLGYGIPDYLQAYNLLSTPVNEILSLQVKVFLEGPFSNGLMNNYLNPYLPLTQPYHISPFNYTGTESVVSIPATDIIDWVLVEIRDATTPDLALTSTVIARQAAFLKQDGTVVGLDGNSPLQFNITYSHNLFVVIRHRNHLGIMASLPLIINAGMAYYDFTGSWNKVYGTSSGYKLLGAGIWGMISGDSNTDGIIDSSDKIPEWTLSAGDSGYLSGDCNLDGQVNNWDKDDFWLVNLGLSTQIPL